MDKFDIFSIVHVKQLDGFGSSDLANDYIDKGWKLLHVGSQVLEDGLTYTAYVVGATKEVYVTYLEEQKSNPFIKAFVEN